MKLHLPTLAGLIFTLSFVLPLSAQTQSAATANQATDYYAAASTAELQQSLIEQAGKSPEGVATKILQHYQDHFIMVAARVKDGGVEVHEHLADFFIVLKGTATLTTGGTVTNPHTVSDGEIRGDAIAGGTSQTLSVGDVVHIPAGIPHQTKMNGAPGFAYLVIKVKQ